MTRSAAQRMRLRILATSDVHMHLLPHDYFTDRPTPGTGLEPLAELIEKLRGEAAAADPPCHTLLVDNGDTLQGTILGDRLAEIRPYEGVHPVAAVMNALGYDAMALGNHDLDYGLDYLAWFARSLSAPLVCSNVVFEQSEDWLAPHCMVEAGGMKVGILSVLPPRTVTALHAQIGAPAELTEMVEAAERASRQLSADGAHVILGLAHTGIGSNDAEDALDAIARTGAVDLLVGGHDHTVFPGRDHSAMAGELAADMDAGTIHGVPAVMPGFRGAFLGCLDIDITRDVDGRCTIGRGRGRVVAAGTGAGPEHPAFDPVRPAHAATRTALEEVIAHTPAPLNSYFARVRPTAVHALNAEAQRIAIDAARQGTGFADLPLLSAVSLPRAGGKGGACNYTDIPAGPVKARHLAGLSVYANFVWAVQMSGAELREWLERSAAAFATIGEGAGLFDTDFPCFDFDEIHGLEYAIDPRGPPRYDRSGNLSNPSGQRIHALCHAGRPVDPEAQFVVAVNSFRACGGGNFPGLHPERPVLRPEIPMAGAIRSFLESGKSPEGATTWRFAKSSDGIATWFDTGPGARQHLADIAHLSPGRPEPQPTGFIRIPITL